MTKLALLAGKCINLELVTCMEARVEASTGNVIGTDILLESGHGGTTVFIEGLTVEEVLTDCSIYRPLSGLRYHL